MSYTVSNHKLQGSGVDFVQSPNTGGKMGAGLPDTIIIHYTAGPSASSAIRTFKDDDANVSAHIVLDFDGKITQMVDFDTVAWHAGKSQLGSRSGFNKYSIGIEIVNAGLLEKDSDGYESWWGKNYPESEVLKAVHRNGGGAKYWHKFTDAQIEATTQLCIALKEAYGIKYIYGHEEISPGRKVDPGPAFPLDTMRGEVFGLKTREEVAENKSAVGKEGKVSASSLNIRSAPNTSGEKMADPLPNGTNVKVLEEGDGWYKVRTTVEIEGWVSAKYIEMD